MTGSNFLATMCCMLRRDYTGEQVTCGVHPGAGTGRHVGGMVDIHHGRDDMQ